MYALIWKDVYLLRKSIIGMLLTICMIWGMSSGLVLLMSVIVIGSMMQMLFQYDHDAGFDKLQKAMPYEASIVVGSRYVLGYGLIVLIFMLHYLFCLIYGAGAEHLFDFYWSYWCLSLQWTLNFTAISILLFYAMDLMKARIILAVISFLIMVVIVLKILGVLILSEDAFTIGNIGQMILIQVLCYGVSVYFYKRRR